MEAKKHIRVLLVEDHPVVREGIKALLHQEAGIAVVGEAASGAQALVLARALSPDVILLDMQLPGMNGLSVAQKLLDEGSSASILVLSAHDGPAFIQNALEMNLAGYLTKDEVPETLVKAVRGVASGERGWLSRRAASRMSEVIRGLHADNQHLLTPREKQVLGGVVRGQTNREIAFSLGIDEKTVEKHLENVFRKLEVASRVEAAVLAIREKIIEI